MRPIDADKIEYFDDDYGFEIAYKVDIDNLPTLTPPNEPLTCEGCDMQGEKVTPCASCIRDPRVCDYYTACRPQEGEVDA